MASGEIDPRHHKYWLSVEFLKVYAQKTLEATILFVDFTPFTEETWSKSFSHTAYQKKAILMLYRNTKVKDRSLVYTDYFDIVAGVLPGDTLAPYLFIICLDYVLW